MDAPTSFNDLFAAPSVAWQRIHPNYRRLRQIGSLVILAVFTVAAIAVAIFLQWWWLVITLVAIGVVLTAIRVALAPRHWRSWGYAELDDELWITHGVMFRYLSAVPYGRIQVVEISSGPIERKLGMATVKVVTASAGTDATIVGLTPEDAAGLRDRLTKLGDALASGL